MLRNMVISQKHIAQSLNLSSDRGRNMKQNAQIIDANIWWVVVR